MKVTLDRPENSEFEITDSQNPLCSFESKKELVSGSYLHYTITFIPSFFSTLIVLTHKDFEKYIKKQDYLIIISCIFTLVIGFGQAYSKILSRKFPFNYLIYLGYSISLALLTAGIAEEFSKKRTFIFISLMMMHGLASYIYSKLCNEKFRVMYGIGFVLGMDFFLALIFGLIYMDYILDIFLINIVVVLISIFILYAMQRLVDNKKFSLLPDDYIMGCMKMSILVPLLEEIFSK